MLFSSHSSSKIKNISAKYLSVHALMIGMVWPPGYIIDYICDLEPNSVSAKIPTSPSVLFQISFSCWLHNNKQGIFLRDP